MPLLNMAEVVFKPIYAGEDKVVATQRDRIPFTPAAFWSRYGNIKASSGGASGTTWVNFYTVPIGSVFKLERITGLIQNSDTAPRAMLIAYEFIDGTFESFVTQGSNSNWTENFDLSFPDTSVFQSQTKFWVRTTLAGVGTDLQMVGRELSFLIWNDYNGIDADKRLLPF